MAVYGTATAGAPLSISPDVMAFHSFDYLADSLIKLVCHLAWTEVNGDRPVVRIPYVADPADAGFVDEGALIPEADPDLDEIVIRTNKIGLVHTLSNEAERAGTASTLVAESLFRSLVSKADAALLNNPVSIDESTGILNLTGVVDGGTLGANLDPFVDALGEIESKGGRIEEAAVIAHPRAWAALSKLKTGTGSNAPLVTQIANTTDPGDGGMGVSTRPQRLLLGTPMFLSPHVPNSSIVVLDRDNVVAAAGDLLLEKSDQARFQNDSVMHRATFRIGWTVKDPTRITKVTVGTTP